MEKTKRGRGGEKSARLYFLKFSVIKQGKRGRGGSKEDGTLGFLIIPTPITNFEEGEIRRKWGGRGVGEE